MTALKDKLSILRYYMSSKLTNALLTKGFINLESKQDKMFQSFKKNVVSKSPHYKQYENLPLSQFPITNKKAHMDAFDRINTIELTAIKAFEIALAAESNRNFSPTHNGVTIGLSSGTSGNRGIFLASHKERNMWAGTILSKCLPNGLLSSTKIAFLLRANSNLYETVNSRNIEFKFHDLINSWVDILCSLEQQNPDVLVAPAQVLERLAQASLSDELMISPSKIISVAEVLSPEARKLIEAAFSVPVDVIYQCTEGFLAQTCSHGTIHLNEENLIIEKSYINDSKLYFSPIITDLRRSSQPIIRYQLDDILKLKQDRCPCGSPLTGIDEIVGRCDDAIVINNKALLPDFIRNKIVAHAEHISDYRVIQHSNDEIWFYINEPEQQENVKAGIESALKIIDETCNVVFKGEITRQSPTEKLRRIRGLKKQV